MMGAQNGMTAGRPSLTMSSMMAGAARLVARLWCRATSVTAERVVDPAIAWKRAGREIAELRQLGERELRDIGIGRADFAAIRRGTFERPAAGAEERIIFHPEAGREPAGKPEAPDFFRPFGPDARWYLHCWFGD